MPLEKLLLVPSRPFSNLPHICLYLIREEQARSVSFGFFHPPDVSREEAHPFDHVFAETNGNDTVTASYVHGPSIDEIIYQNKAASGDHYFIRDRLGSTRGLKAASGGATIEQILQKVEDNAALVQDYQADIAVTSTDPMLPAVATMHIWEKGDLQKVEQYTPTREVHIRPQPVPYTGPAPAAKVRQIVSINTAENVYAIKTTEQGQTDIYPYSIDYIDYDTGVVVKTEHYSRGFQGIFKWVNEHANFVEIGGAQLFQYSKEEFYDDASLVYSTENTFSNIQINTAIADSEFE
jgi:outer membrane lipoprotein-sorting protein